MLGAEPAEVPGGTLDNRRRTLAFRSGVKLAGRRFDFLQRFVVDVACDCGPRSSLTALSGVRARTSASKRSLIAAANRLRTAGYTSSSADAAATRSSNGTSVAAVTTMSNATIAPMATRSAPRRSERARVRARKGGDCAERGARCPA